MLQFKKRMHKSIIILVSIAALACSSFVFAHESHDPSLLDTAREKSKQCVDDTNFMRSNHMEKILHQRDNTMRKGIRGEAYSLNECISCHVPENTNIRYGDDKHFCSSCHNYTAVTIDCFQCHTDRVTTDNKQSSHSHAKHHYADKSAGIHNDTATKEYRNE